MTQKILEPLYLSMSKPGGGKYTTSQGRSESLSILRLKLSQGKKINVENNKFCIRADYLNKYPVIFS